MLRFVQVTLHCLICVLYLCLAVAWPRANSKFLSVYCPCCIRVVGMWRGLSNRRSVLAGSVNTAHVCTRPSCVAILHQESWDLLVLWPVACPGSCQLGPCLLLAGLVWSFALFSGDWLLRCGCRLVAWLLAQLGLSFAAAPYCMCWLWQLVLECQPSVPFHSCFI